MDGVTKKCVHCLRYVPSKDMRKHYLVDHGWVSISSAQTSNNLQPPKKEDNLQQPKKVDTQSNEMLLLELKPSHLSYVHDSLDYSAKGNDYMKLAKLFGMSRENLEQLSLSYLRGKRPSEQLIRYLNMRHPELTVKEFGRKCNEMNRVDIVDYLKNIALKKSETLLLNKVEYEHQMRLSSYLDYTITGNNYKKLAKMCSVSRDGIEQLSLARFRGERPTEQLIQLLNMEYPEMTLKEFMSKCQDIDRLDVVAYIREHIFKE